MFVGVWVFGFVCGVALCLSLFVCCAGCLGLFRFVCCAGVSCFVFLSFGFCLGLCLGLCLYVCGLLVWKFPESFLRKVFLFFLVFGIDFVR